MSKSIWRNNLTSGAIRIMAGEYSLNKFLLLRGNDIIVFGDGSNKVFVLEQSISLKRT